MSETEPSSIDQLRERLMLATLPHVAFDGWTRLAAERGAADLGLPPGEVARLFPGGPIEILECFSLWADRRLLEEAGRRDMAEVRVRDRVAAVVRLRIEVIAPYREAVARGVSFQMLPFNAPVAIKCLFHTVDSLWRAAGDRATDFTYYTKRLTLAGLWSTTLLYWLADHSPEYEATWRFLDRRLDATLTCGRLVADLNDLAARMPDPFRFLGGFRRPRQ